jgi:pimeloyl-ACP methyl ester carboxylesterase
MPVTVIWGDEDTYSPIAIGEELAELVPDAMLTRIAGADRFWKRGPRRWRRR